MLANEDTSTTMLSSQNMIKEPGNLKYRLYILLQIEAFLQVN